MALELEDSWGECAHVVLWCGFACSGAALMWVLCWARCSDVVSQLAITKQGVKAASLGVLGLCQAGYKWVFQLPWGSKSLQP